MALLNRDSVYEMYNQEKILVGCDTDGVLETRVAELFGRDAVDRVVETEGSSGRLWNVKDGVRYFSRSGFLEAAACYNFAQIVGTKWYKE